MAKEPEEEQQQAYYIPWNYDEAGGVLGGKVTTRNAIELAVLCGPLAFLEYHLLRFSWQTNLTIAMITLIPLAAFCLIGFGKESISQRVFALYRFHKRQRKLSYMYFTEYQGVANKKFSIDSFLDDVSSVGLKKAIENISKAKGNVESTENDEVEEDTPSPKKKFFSKAHESVSDGLGSEEYTDTSKPIKRAQAAPKARSERPSTQSNKWMNSAMKEMLLKKLELGDDDDEFGY